MQDLLHREAASKADPPMMSTASQVVSAPDRERPGFRRGATLPAAALLAACAAASASAPVSEPTTAVAEPVRQDLEFKLEAGQSVHIDNPYGSVFLRFGGYEHQLGLHTTLQQPAQAAPIEFAPRATERGFEIAPRLAKGAAVAPGQRFDLVAYVPQQHAVDARTLDGVIESRGLKSDLSMRSESGDLAARGSEGLVQAETASGSIEVAFAAAAAKGSRQRLATRTGAIIVGVTDALDAEVQLASSAPFATDYSLEVSSHPGQEPNKTALARIGKPDPKQPSILELHSLRGEIRLLRRAVYVDAPVATPAPSG